MNVDRKIKFRLIFLTILIGVFFGLAKSSEAATLYVDNTLSSDCAGGNYSIANRNCSGSDGRAYNTIQEAINASAVGDAIKMRGGTYAEIDIDVPASKNGTAWTAGNFTTLKSFNGEWAKVDGTGLSGGTTNNMFRHTTGYDKRTGANATSYWKFENFEVTGGRNGFWFTEGPLWFRYMYIHDNGRDEGDEICAGIWINLAKENIIEYSWIANNQKPTPTDNSRNIGFDSDYRDDEYPDTFDEAHCVRKNIIRYNIFDGSRRSVSHKNQQRFGTASRIPSEVAENYGSWGDLVHHNIVRNPGAVGISLDQDNAQVYNNIVSMDSASTQKRGVQLGAEHELSSDRPILYNMAAYNNTVLKMNKSFGTFSGEMMTDSHPFVYFYNNIAEQNQTAITQYFPFVIAADMTAGYFADLSNSYIKNNLSHSPTNADYFLMRGRADKYSLSGAQGAFSTVANNYQNDIAGLFSGASGADRYITNGNFSLSGSAVIANAGIGGAHPYLDGVNLPSYIGATNPDDNAWVAGVLSLSTLSNLQNGGANDPEWIEGGGGSSSDTAPPAAPQGLSVQ